jgi:hypothetical protein
MKTMAWKEQFLTEAGGKRVGVLPDMDTDERLQEAAEELADIRADDAARPKATAENANGQSATLAEDRANRA